MSLLTLLTLLITACGDDNDQVPDLNPDDIVVGQFEPEVFSNLTVTTVESLETPYESTLATLAGGRVLSDHVSFADLAAELESIFPGATVLELELEEERGLKVWDIEMIMPGGGFLEAVIVPEILEILEIEGQTGPFTYTVDPGGSFITLAEAIAIAQTAQPGEVERWELELEEGDEWEYEIHITDGTGEWEIELNAFTGEFLEQNEKGEEDEDEFEEPGEPAPQEIIDLVANFIDGDVAFSEMDDDEDNTIVWKVFVKTAGGALVEIAFDQATSELVEAEDDKGPFDYEFTPGEGLLPFSETMGIALEAFPGELVEWELESDENDDDPDVPELWVYSFQIESSNDDEDEVEIDAATGEILE